MKNHILTFVALVGFAQILGCKFLEQGTPGSSNDGGKETAFGEKQPGTDVTSETTSDQVIIVSTTADLPVCAETNVNQVYYVESSKEYFVCSQEGMKPLDIDPDILILQNCDSEDLLSVSETIVVGDAKCSEGLGGATIKLGCDINGNSALDENATPSEISESRDVCNTSAPPQTTADMALAVSPVGSDTANCQEATPCATFATTISKVPKTINHTVTIKVNAGMTLNEEVTVQGFTIGSSGTLDIRSTTEGTQFTVDGQDTRDNAILVEGVSGSGRFILHDVVVTHANVAGLNIDSSIADLGLITATNNGTSGDAAGILLTNDSNIKVLQAADGGPYLITSSNNTGDGLTISVGAEAVLSELTINSTKDGIRVTGNSELSVSALAGVSSIEDKAIVIDNSIVSLTGDTAIAPQTGGGYGLTTTGTVVNSIGTAGPGSGDIAVLISTSADVSLTNLSISTNGNEDTIQSTESRLQMDGVSVVSSGGATNFALNAQSGSTVKLYGCVFDQNPGKGIRASGSTIVLNDENPNTTNYIRGNGTGAADGLGFGVTVDNNGIMQMNYPYDIQGNGDGGDEAIIVDSGVFSRTILGDHPTDTPSFVCEDGSNGAAAGCEISCTDLYQDAGEPDNPTLDDCANPQL